MKLILTWLGLTMLSVHVVRPDVIPSSKVEITLNYVKMCPDHLDVPSTYDNISMIIDPDTNMLFISGDLNIKEEIPLGSDLSLDFRKCYNEKASSCERYVVTNIEDFCQHLPEKDRAWTEFFKHMINLETKCPVPVGSYKIEEAPLDMSYYENVTEFVGHWEVEMAFTANNKMMGCLLADMDLTLPRSG